MIVKNAHVTNQARWKSVNNGDKHQLLIERATVTPLATYTIVVIAVNDAGQEKKSLKLNVYGEFDI